MKFICTNDKKLTTDVKALIFAYEMAEKIESLGICGNNDFENLMTAPSIALSMLFGDENAEETETDIGWEEIVRNKDIDINQKISLLYGLKNNIIIDK